AEALGNDGAITGSFETFSVTAPTIPVVWERRSKTFLLTGLCSTGFSTRLFNSSSSSMLKRRAR
ncbi:11146_t:CDS:1, partial [Racocetra fulgida]